MVTGTTVRNFMQRGIFAQLGQKLQENDMVQEISRGKLFIPRLHLYWQSKCACDRFLI